MRLTNKLGLPEPIFAALRDDDYSRGDSWRSVTQLVDSPRRVLLYERYDDELEEDVSDRLWLLMGKSIHAVFQHSGDSGIREKRWFMECEGKKISGATDHLDVGEKTLTDYKVTSVFTAKKGGRDEWVAQTNLYRLLCAENGIAVDRLQLAIICRDWRPGEAKREANYPRPFVLLPVPVWDLEQTRAYLRDRVRLHLEAETAVPLCSPGDRWQRPDQWAVMQLGRKSAVFYSNTKEEAAELQMNYRNRYVEFRPGEPTRCLQYCAAKAVCQRLSDGQWRDGEDKEAA